MRVITVDDEALSRTRLRQLLRAEPDVEIVAECATGASAIEATERLQPDVLFLDVQMPEISGFDVVAALPNTPPPLIIFVTAFDEYAVRAFDVLALDYVLKPIAAERLAAACAKARGALDSSRGTGSADDRLLTLLAQLRADGRVAESSPRRLFVRTNNRVTMVDPGQVRWLEAAGNYVKIHTKQTSYTVRQKLSEMETLLDQHNFARIHRSSIVNLDYVKEFQPWFSGEMIVVMDDGTKLKLSRTYRQEFESRHRILS